MIEARGITRRFGPVTAVRDLSFSVPARCVCGVLGPNGAGKTTTIRMLAGLLLPDAGALSVAGYDVVRAPREVRARVGYLPESAPLPPELRVREVLRFRAGLLGLGGATATRAIDEAIDACDLGPVAGRLVAQLSKGYRQRTGLAAAILARPEVLILDEPSVGLDPRQLVGFRALLRRLGTDRTVLLSSHQLAEVEASCDRAILLRAGVAVAEGTLGELRAKAGAARVAIEARHPDPAAAFPPAVRERLRASGPARDLGDGWFLVECAVAAPDAGDPRADAVAALVAAGIAFREVRLERPSLENLFLAATDRAEVAA